MITPASTGGHTAPASVVVRMAAPRVRVLIIEDSATVRTFLAHLIRKDPRLEVVGTAATAEEGLRLLVSTRPDVVSMDIRLPGMNGFEATRQIMAECPTPIVVVAASVDSQNLNIAMNALKAGALSVVEKPVGSSHADYAALSAHLCTQLAIMSKVSVVRQRFHRRQLKKQALPVGNRSQCSLQDPQRRTRFVGLVASTGGPRALHYVLSRLPQDFPVPIALVQHITTSFHVGFVHWLDRGCSLSVESAKRRYR